VGPQGPTGFNAVGSQGPTAFSAAFSQAVQSGLPGNPTGPVSQGANPSGQMSQMVTQLSTGLISGSTYPQTVQPDTVQVQVDATLSSPSVTCGSLTSSQVSLLRTQLASMCDLWADPQRIIAITLTPIPGKQNMCALRFGILNTNSAPRALDAWNYFYSQLVQDQRGAQLTIQDTTGYLQLTPTAYYWTAGGQCPSQTCRNGGQCQLDLTGTLSCKCPSGYDGTYCDDKNWNLLGLLVIPILLVLLLVGLLVYCLMRRYRKGELTINDVKKGDVTNQHQYNSSVAPVSTISVDKKAEPGSRDSTYSTATNHSYPLAMQETIYFDNEELDKTSQSPIYGQY
jgi:hypothetical protein